MDPLENRIQEYAWGSTRAIAELLGVEAPSARPQAELWMGAHPNAPSRVWRDGSWRSLADVIAANPEAELGLAVHARFGAALPFLFKVLAAETPLSLQAHPSSEQASAGFAAEERLGLARNAPQRNYKDAQHKPELVCALSTFHALCGFREIGETLRLFGLLGVAPLERAARAVAQRPAPDALRELFAWLVSRAGSERRELVASIAEACSDVAKTGGAFADECGWAARIAGIYPDDVGVVVSLLLNFVRLSPGEALYLPAGQLHAYLGGVAIEIMANSDNVLRAGLTPKHVDVPELMRILEFTDGPAVPRRAIDESGELVYPTPSPEFRLSRIELRSGAPFRLAKRGGPEIVLCTEGTAMARGQGGTLPLARGASIFVPASDPDVELTGAGTVFRATVGTL